MKSIENIMNEIRETNITEWQDCQGIELENGFGLFLQIDRIDGEDEEYYFTEFNEIEEDENWNPLDTTIIYKDTSDLKNEIERFLNYCMDRYNRQ